MMNTQTNYGNWVPEKMFPPLFGGGAVLLAAVLAYDAYERQNAGCNGGKDQR